MIKTHSEEKTFVTTDAVNTAWVCVNENRIVIIIGAPGTGKSRIALELLRKMSIDGKRCIKLDDIEQWQDMSDGMESVFIDDVFGRTNCSYNDNAHSKLLELIYTTIQNKNIKVILTLRKNIYQNITSDTDHHRLFRDQHILDLSSDKNQLTVEEKKSLLKKYLTKNKIFVTDDIKKENVTEDSIINTDSTVYIHEDTLQKILNSDIGIQIGFPETCYLFASHRKFTKQSHNFFCHPTEQLAKELDNFRIEGDTNKRSMISFSLLVYILLNGDSINIDEIDEEEFQKLMETMYLNHLANISISHIKIAAKQLLGNYLKINNDGNYCFQHRLISEAVLISYSVTDTRSLIPLLGFDFITEMARPQFYKPSEGEVIFPVPTSCYSLLAQRLLQLLQTHYNSFIGPYHFVQNLCKSKIITMTNNDILQEMIKQYKYESLDDHLILIRYQQFLNDYRLSQRYHISTSYFYLPSALLMFCNIDSVYQCLYDKIHNTLTSESHSDVMKACKKSLIESFNFAVCTLDVKRLTVILTILTDHNINYHDTRWFCENIVRCQGLPVVQLLLSLDNTKISKLHDFCQVCNITDLLSQIFRSFTENVINLDDNMKQLINNKYDMLPVGGVLEFVCEQGQLDYVKEVCGRFDSSLFDVDDMIIAACIGRNPEVIQWLVEKYHGLYNVQRVLNEACYLGYIKGVRIILNKSDHTLLDVKTLMNKACSRGKTVLVKWLCEKFDNNLFDMKTAMNEACRWGNTELVKWLCEKFDNNLFDMKTVMNETCRWGNTKLVKWLCEKFDNNLFDMKTAIYSAHNGVFFLNNTELIEWLQERFGHSIT